MSTVGDMRMLVAIASYGMKNLELLKRAIGSYKALPLHVDVVVVSEAPKDLGPDVKVVVGLPAKNPWSLPFAHKKIFAEELENYDLFAYGEDDMEITPKNVQSFLEVTPHLAADEIAGFLRYEIDEHGMWSLPEMHLGYHWKARSVQRRGELTVAEFSNEHAAFYLLTRSQLRAAIASGGFLLEPYEGRYDMLCSAATDPYTRCGFRKVICVSRLDDFLIHHMSNRYAGRLGLTLPECRQQVETLIRIGSGEHPAKTLTRSESSLLHGTWSKSYYEEADDALVSMIPANARTILSVGCGAGELEQRLVERGLDVLAVPLDSVISETAARRGIKIACAEVDDGFVSLNGERFDCVVSTNLLHLAPEPERLVRLCAERVAEGGSLVVAGPNFQSVAIRAKRALGVRDYRKLSAFDVGGCHALSARAVAKHAAKAGLTSTEVRYVRDDRSGSQWNPLGSLMARRWVVRASR